MVPQDPSSPSIEADVDSLNLAAPNDNDISPPRGNPFPVVGIGASAGGLEAFGQLLSFVPAGTGMAFVLVQHLDPQHESLLADLLVPFVSIPLVTVRDEMAIQPDHIYVIPPNTSMVLEDGHLRLGKRESGLHLPIDIFFRSLARVQGSRAIGVVLSGNASDGSLGVSAIKSECGITFAQSEASARFSGMPRSAIATGSVDFILSPQEIGRELAIIGAHPYLIPSLPGVAATETLPEGDKELAAIFRLLFAETRVDFSRYKPTTIRRRIGRRMMVLRVNGLGEYARYAEAHRSEVRELYRDLLISVTSFFRDPEVFTGLQQLLRGPLEDREDLESSIRLWVPGCATGEEVYSLAICLHELVADLRLQVPIQIFGTDISEVALERARQGIYTESIADDVTPERLKRFFLHVETGYQISKSVRESCIFARHDVTQDPPFSNLDIISCRNLLIYLNASQQRRVFPMFHYALKPSGLLVLGTAETTGKADDLFIPVEKQLQVYRRSSAPVRLPFTMELTAPQPLTGSKDRSNGSVSLLDMQRKVDRVIQSKYSPDAVLVNADLQILQFRGHTSRYLAPSAGEASLNLLRMANEELIIPLRRAVQAALEQNVSVRELATMGGSEAAPLFEVLLEVTPVAGSSSSDRYLLIVFQDKLPAKTLSSEDVAAFADDRLKLMAQELAETREYLRNLSEDYEAHAEELRAANEEARSANEELQSTNEELGTTKEELQSTNEELVTVNEELQSRNFEITATNSDLKNLLSTVSVAILMVDQDLRLRRFNASAEKLVNLSAIDIGRPVGHLRGEIEVPHLEGRVRAVIETLHPSTEEVQGKDGRWVSVSIRPYRTLDNHIAGAVIAIQDIDFLKRSLKAAEEARDYAESMIKTVREPLVVLDSDLRVLRATTAFYETFLVSRDETEGRLIYDLGNGQWNQPRLRELLGAALFNEQPFHDLEIKHAFPHIGPRTMRLNAQRIPLPGDKPRVLLAIEDTTERRELAEIRFQRLFETAKDGIVVVDTEALVITDVNPFFLQLTGSRLEEVLNKHIHHASPFAGTNVLSEWIARQADGSVLRLEDFSLKRHDGTEVCVDIVGNSYLVGTQRVAQLNLRDITPRKEAAVALQKSEQRFRLFVESVRDYGLFQLDTQGIIDTWTSGAERLLGWTEAEAVGQPAHLVFTPEDVAAGRPQVELDEARREGRAEDERWHIRKDGSRFFASGVLTRVDGAEGDLRGFAKIMRDVTEQKAVEERLQQQAALLDLAYDAILVRQLDGRILFWNRGAEMLYGWSAEQAVGKSLYQLLRTEFSEPVSAINTKLVEEGHWDGVLQHKHQDGTSMTVASRWALQRGEGSQLARVLEINVDITASKEQEERLQRSLEEKSMLVREIHHRVKNNLQVIVSLLSLQAGNIKDPAVVAAFEEAESRVRAIAQIHERLYASDDLTEVEFGGYLTHLSQELVALYANAPDQISLSMQVQEMVLHIEQAIPLGLIANELIINSLKHGLRSASGTLEVSLHYLAERIRADLGETLDDGWARIRIKDNGPGLPASLSLESSQSLGFRLITLLIKQLQGKLTIGSGPGTDITVEFPLKDMRDAV